MLLPGSNCSLYLFLKQRLTDTAVRYVICCAKCNQLSMYFRCSSDVNVWIAL